MRTSILHVMYLLEALKIVSNKIYLDCGMDMQRMHTLIPAVHRQIIRLATRAVWYQNIDWCFLFVCFFNLTYSRWSLRIFPSLPGSRLTIFNRNARSALLQLVNQSVNNTVIQ